jgi:hypothetical protein
MTGDKKPGITLNILPIPSMTPAIIAIHSLVNVQGDI